MTDHPTPTQPTEARRAEISERLEKLGAAYEELVPGTRLASDLNQGAAALRELSRLTAELARQTAQVEGMRAEIAGRHARATPGPYTAQFHHTKDYAGRSHAFITAGSLVPLAAVVLAAEGCDQAEGRATATFLAHSWADVKWLLAELARQTAMVPEGYVLVPVEPTKEMMRVAANKWKDWRITWDTGLTNLAAPMVSPLYLTYKQMIAARPTLSEVAQSPYAFLNEYGREIEISVKAGVHIEIIGPDSRITLDLTPKEASRLKAGLDEYLAARPTPVGSNALHDASCAAAAGPGSADCTCARPTPADSGEGR